MLVRGIQWVSGKVLLFSVCINLGGLNVVKTQFTNVVMSSVYLLDFKLIQYFHDFSV